MNCGVAKRYPIYQRQCTSYIRKGGMPHYASSKTGTRTETGSHPGDY